MILPSLESAGMEVMVARMAMKLARRGHDVGVTCIVAPGPLAVQVEEAGVRVRDPGARGLADPRWLFRLASHLRQIRPDVAHLHSGAWFKGATAARAAGVARVVYTAHGFVAREARTEAMLNRVAVPLTHAIVAVSDHLAEVMRGRGLAGGGKLSVISNGIDLDAFRPRDAPSEGTDDLRRRLGLAPQTLLAGTVARLEPIKNQAMLVEGLALARAAGVDCAAVLIGDGSLRGELESMAARLGVAEHIHFWGLERDVAPLYRQFDVFTLTSDAEGTSISLLEAMASGVCPLATRVGGNPAVIGEAGVLVDARCPEQLAGAIGELARDGARRLALGSAARARVSAMFSDEAMLDAYERVYRG
jgi:glycosyltransferase involved in cell wall biosynthesis